jgi:hypothetical protein
LFEVDIVVGVVVVVVGLAIALAIPCVHQLMVWSKGRVRFYEIHLYAQGIEGKCCDFIYLNKDEVVDKVPKQPTTPTKHTQTQTLIIKQKMTNTTLLLTRVTPNDCEIWRGSGYSLWAPCLNPGPRRSLTRCLCLTHRGHWPDPLPSSCSLRWWHLRSAAGCGESQSHAERPVDECSAPPSHPGGVPSPSWEYPSSPHRP